MKSVRVRLVVGSFVMLALVFLLLYASSFVSAGSISQEFTFASTYAPYGRVGPGSWEAECATIIQSPTVPWEFRKAARASKAAPNCSAVSGKNYLESKRNGNKVCLDFKDADRVGISYVAGNYKGNLQYVVDFTDSTPDYSSVTDMSLPNHDIVTYDGYEEPTANVPPPNGFIDDEIEEGDFDSSAANATLTFHAFSWIWKQDDYTQPDKRGTVCVNPRGKVPQSGAAWVSLDYFVVANGKPKAVRGVGTGATPLTQDHVNALWTWSVDDFAFPPPNGILANEAIAAPSAPANWKGFIPKLASQTGRVGDSTVQSVIDNTRAQPYGDSNIPRYWVIFNEPDLYEPDVSNPVRLDDFIYNVKKIVAVYATNNLGFTPKIIIGAGSQYHIPGLVNLNTGGEWGSSGCIPPPPPLQGQNYDCRNPEGVWIEDFWNALQTKSDFNLIKQYIGGIEGHYYQPADSEHCNPREPRPTLTPKDAVNCRTNTVHVTNMVQAMRNWLDANQLPNGEVWILETSTALEGLCGITLAQQSDSVQCLGRTANMRNYAGKLQKALGDQGIIDRWAWYADRWGTFNPCHPDDPNTPAIDPRSDGEMSALNRLCNGVQLSPYGQNSKLSAQYR